MFKVENQCSINVDNIHVNIKTDVENYFQINVYLILLIRIKRIVFAYFDSLF